MNVITKIDTTVRKFNMLENGDTVVVGVSGGKDSMLLLNYLLLKRDEYNLKLIVANVEHGIRGETSKRDSSFVEDFCRDNDLEFRGLEINAPFEAKEKGVGVEEYSRLKRYEFFSSFCADKIATAHSLSDNVETVIFRLARGTSLKGVKGIPPVRGTIIRPLIECSADEIVNACKELEIPYVTDETNFENDYARNMIRNRVMPLLNEINPQAENAINRFSYFAVEDDNYITSQAEKYVDDKLDLAELKRLDSSVKRRVLELYAERFGIVLDVTHLSEVLALTLKPGKTQLRNNLFAVSNKNSLYITEFDEKEVEFVTVSKTVTVDDFKVNKSDYLNKFAFYCDADKINGDVTVRQREAGDEITLASRNCTKSLKKLFNELEIPIEMRYRVPVVSDESSVIGVYGYALSARVSIDEGTSRVFLLNIKTEDKN